jgi:FixJ family two-component response regulator
VLFLSGYTDTTVAGQGLLDGGAEFLQKPFGSETLVRRVREVLDAPPVAK